MTQTICLLDGSALWHPYSIGRSLDNTLSMGQSISKGIGLGSFRLRKVGMKIKYVMYILVSLYMYNFIMVYVLFAPRVDKKKIYIFMIKVFYEYTVCCKQIETVFAVMSSWIVMLGIQGYRQLFRPNTWKTNIFELLLWPKIIILKT